MDGDGDLDVVACALIAPNTSETSSLSEDVDSIIWFEQTSAKQFVRHSLESGQCHHPTLALSDYDLDGDVDLLVGNGQLHLTIDPERRSCVDLWKNELGSPSESP